MFCFKLGLKNGILIRSKETEMVIIMQDIYHQNLRMNILKKDNIIKHRVKTALK